MDNRHLYRGKRLDNGEWVKGDYNYSIIEEAPAIRHYVEDGGNTRERFAAVIPETVGQCTGLTADESYRGTEPEDRLIYEGDILKGFQYPFFSDGLHNYYAEIVWFDNSPAFGLYTHKNPQSDVRGISAGNADYLEDFQSDDWEIIGNRWDNPELLEVGDKRIKQE